MATVASRRHAAALVLLALLLPLARAQPQPQPTYTNVSDGVPVVGYSPPQGSAFFRFVAPLPLPRIDIVVVALAGQPSLYVTLGRFWDPEPTNYLYAAAGDAQDEIVTIAANATPTTLGDTCNPAQYSQCYVNVNVFGARAANWSLTITTAAGSGLLSPGVPAVGALRPGEADYYNFSVSAATPPASVTFRVSPAPGATAATPGLFVASNARGSARPSPGDASSFCASATAPAPLTGVETVVVLNSSACACAPPTVPGGDNCTYFVGVANQAAPAPGAPALGYSLVATTSAGAYTLLQDGVPVGGSGNEGAAGAAFLFNALGVGAANATGRVEVSAAPRAGSVLLYVVLGAAAAAARPSRPRPPRRRPRGQRRAASPARGSQPPPP